MVAYLEPNRGPETDRVVVVQSLFVEHMPALRGFILALMPDFELVNDTLQETFLTVTRKAGNFEPGSNFLGWAFSIARFKVLEVARRKRRAEHLLSDEVIEALVACQPEEEDSAHRLEHLKDCLKTLAPQAQRAILLRYQQAQRPVEIARLMSWTPESVYVALSRARTALRDCVNRAMAREA